MGASEPATQCIIVLVTAPSQDEARAIAHHLVENKLAACVTLLPVTSIYVWDEQVQQDQEWQLIIKTEQRHFAELATQIQTVHSYEVPEIIALPIIAGSQPYLNWIGKQVQTS